MEKSKLTLVFKNSEITGLTAVHWLQSLQYLSDSAV